ncbi:hypothetical protein fHeYen901_209 [Yersinia phage fHe-Yen9-01]|uniref:IraD/Gp25-like domain-containing protein n=2 Tax=Tegunavirus TaxID=1921704 RepID=A0A1V0DXV0_9CAUD|nr:baseplate wedge subunit [Yersinia phage fHe-Yen9-01]ARB05982.1 hypothetical protein fHeYen901_209 [Yersinia phage fHe-Yen9-01]
MSENKTINVLYTDLDPTLGINWDKDIGKITGLRAVKNSLLGIITTRKGERAFMPDFGCNLSDELFENMTPLTADTIQRGIVASVRSYEPRIDKLNVEVTPVYDDNVLIVSIYFSIVDNPDTIEQIKVQLQSR